MEMPQPDTNAAQLVSMAVHPRSNGILRPTAVRSFLARICQTQNPTKTMKKSEITGQGLDTVGFIGIENSPKHPFRPTIMRIAKRGERRPYFGT